jgi:hypothetical protein
MDLYELSMLIRSYLPTMPFVEDCIIYISSSDSLIINGARTNTKLAYDMHFKNSGMTYEEWLSWLLGRGTRGRIYPIRKDAEGKTIQTAAYIQRIPVSWDYASRKASVIITFNIKVFEKILENSAFLDNSYSCIVDNNNLILASEGKADYWV